MTNLSLGKKNIIYFVQHVFHKATKDNNSSIYWLVQENLDLLKMLGKKVQNIILNGGALMVFYYVVDSVKKNTLNKSKFL